MRGLTLAIHDEQGIIVLRWGVNNVDNKVACDAGPIRTVVLRLGESKCDIAGGATPAGASDRLVVDSTHFHLCSRAGVRHEAPSRPLHPSPPLEKSLKCHTWLGSTMYVCSCSSERRVSYEGHLSRLHVLLL